MKKEDNMATFTGIGKLLSDAVFNALTTKSKNVIGAINELKADMDNTDKSVTVGSISIKGEDIYLYKTTYGLGIRIKSDGVTKYYD